MKSTSDKLYPNKPNPNKPVMDKLDEQVELNVLAWLEGIVPDNAEMRAIEEEERAKFNLASGLRHARKSAGHTQATLAKELGVPQSLISKWEHIDHNHTLETLLNLMRATGAKLVLGLEVNGELIPVTSAAERCLLLSETTQATLEQRAIETGLSTREILIAPLARERSVRVRPTRRGRTGRELRP